MSKRYEMKMTAPCSENVFKPKTQGKVPRGKRRRGQPRETGEQRSLEREKTSRI